MEGEWFRNSERIDFVNLILNRIPSDASSDLRIRERVRVYVNELSPESLLPSNKPAITRGVKIALQAYEGMHPRFTVERMAPYVQKRRY